MEKILDIALENQKRAYEVIDELRIVDIWRSIGADAHLVGSLKTGLLMKHKDIDFHIYSPQVSVSESFAAISRIAENSHITRIEYGNLLQTEEQCIEWHLFYCGENVDDLWQIDMIHIVMGSLYDGYFEKVAERISKVLTPETRGMILKLKYETPDDTKIMGIEYCRAVLEGGVSSYGELTEWRKCNPVSGIESWMP